MKGSEAMDRLDYLNSCHEMGGNRIDAADEHERQLLNSIFESVGGRDGMDALTPAELHRIMRSVREYWGMACPSCGKDDDLQVSAIHLLRLTDEGTEDLAGDDEFDDGSLMFCEHCNHRGVVRDFYVDTVDREDAPCSGSPFVGH